jgi:hypothetical protein
MYRILHVVTGNYLMISNDYISENNIKYKNPPMRHITYRTFLKLSMVGSLAEFRTRREAQMVLDFLYIKGNVDYNNNYIEKSFITDNYNKCEFEIVNV